MKEGTSSAADQTRAEQSAQALFQRDAASRALGMRLIAVRPGWARVAMTVRADMLNGHGLCHGGLLFALADSAFAFSCNSHGEPTVAAAASVVFLVPVRGGDELSAEAAERWRTRRHGLYDITVTNQRGECVALFRGRAYRLSSTSTAKD
jgi:acyl-CoA thioesterase